MRTATSTPNRKLGDSGIVDCPQIEEAKPCIYMEGPSFAQSPKCPGCWASRLWKIRNANWRETGKLTPEGGFIRLGNWKEILPEEWESFKAGRGLRSDGTLWEQPSLSTRPYFLITRGLLSEDFYRRVAADPYCLNIQVSTDINRRSGSSLEQIPGDDRLRFFLDIPKVIFRFKTLAGHSKLGPDVFMANVEKFVELADRLSIPSHRILETPLRLGDHSYQTTTPLEGIGWDPRRFMRCNSKCDDCPGKDGAGENRILACGATARMLDILAKKGNILPRRVEKVPKDRIPWTALVTRALNEQGGEAELSVLYAVMKRLEPKVLRNPLWDVKVRQVVQRIATRTGPGTWKLGREAASALPTLPMADVGVEAGQA